MSSVSILVRKSSSRDIEDSFNERIYDIRETKYWMGEELFRIWIGLDYSSEINKTQAGWFVYRRLARI